MSFQTKKVSNSKITVEKNEVIDIPAKGSDWISEPYANIFLLAKKKSGKTTVIRNMLNHFAGKNTKFVFIVSTINKDKTWIDIVKYWQDKGNDMLTYDDIYDGDNNVISEFIKNEKESTQKPEDTKTVITETKILSQSGNGVRRYKIIEKEIPIENKTANKSQKLIYPEYIFVLDDLGSRMRDKAVTQFLKTNRHYKSKVIMSAQNITDLEPAAIAQIDYTLVFGRVPDDRIERLREILDLDIDKDDFLRLYKNATSEPFQFLYIGRQANGDIFRKGFNDQYITT